MDTSNRNYLLKEIKLTIIMYDIVLYQQLQNVFNFQKVVIIEEIIYSYYDFFFYGSLKKLIFKHRYIVYFF